VSRLLTASAGMTFRKAVAVWLLLLALSPFTAPFSTCDLSALSSRSPTGGFHFGTLSPPSETLVDEAIAQLQSPESPVAGRAKFFVTLEAATLPLVSLQRDPRASHPPGSSQSRSRATTPTGLRI
jgi:hypothetical protein